MATRQIKNYLGQVTGELTLPEGTTEQEWAERLNGYNFTPLTAAQNALKFTVADRKRYADDLMERLKQENIRRGINVKQALYMHHTFRELPIIFDGLQMKIDLLNLIVSGDVECGIIALLCTTGLHSGTEAYHWFTPGLRDWIVADMKNYLGWV